MNASIVQLPVGRQGFVDMAVNVAVFQLPLRDMRHEFGAEIVRQRRRVVIHVDEHEAAPTVRPWPRAVKTCRRFDMGEIPIADRFLQRAVEVPAPAVEAALEFAGATLAAGGAQLGAAMQAGIVIGANIVLSDTRDDERVPADIVDVIVAHFRDMLLAAGELPGAGPQIVKLLFGVGGIDVAIDGDVLIAEEFDRTRERTQPGAATLSLAIISCVLGSSGQRASPGASAWVCSRTCLLMGHLRPDTPEFCRALY